MIDIPELAACAFYALSVWLAARSNIHTWWVGILGCFLYGWVFFSAKLYADVTLQLFFAITSIAGWISWRRGLNGKVLAVRKTPRLQSAALTVVAAVVAIGYAALLHRFTDAWSPWLDSLILTFSVLGQFLMMGRRIESWYVWLLVNTIAVPLYGMRDLYLTSALYAFFWCSAWYGLSNWRKEMEVR